LVKNVSTYTVQDGSTTLKGVEGHSDRDRKTWVLKKDE
jgi:hypothetical protein